MNKLHITLALMLTTTAINSFAENGNEECKWAKNLELIELPGGAFTTRDIDNKTNEAKKPKTIEEFDGCKKYMKGYKNYNEKREKERKRKIAEIKKKSK